MPAPVVIVDYDPAWPDQFAREKAAIVAAIGSHILAVEHVGSTAVPGLGAKPIIDIMIGLRDLADARHCITPLVDLGYTYVPEYEADLPERRYFSKGRGTAAGSTHHLHMVAVTSAFWERHLLFRDYLRAHPAARDAYDQLKRRLAVTYRDDRPGYTEAKTAFITRIEQQARTTLQR